MKELGDMEIDGRRLTKACILLALLVWCLLGIMSPALAQTHPCDQPAQVNPTIASGAPHRLQFCQPQGDQIEAALAMVDGTPIDLVPVAAKTGPNATGLVLYETNLFLQVSRGSHILTLATYNRNAITGAPQIGAASAPFPFAAVDDTPVPTAPQLKGVTR